MRKKRKLSIHGKAIAGIILFTLLINIGMCLSGSVIFDRAVQKIYNERGYVVANIILKQIDHDKIAEFRLNPGDSIFVYTDGVAEATNSATELYGADRMLEALNKMPDANAKELLENVKKDIDEFVEDSPQFDDITMLCFKWK